MFRLKKCSKMFCVKKLTKSMKLQFISKNWPSFFFCPWTQHSVFLKNQLICWQYYCWPVVTFDVLIESYAWDELMLSWIRPFWVVNHVHLGSWHLINKHLNCCRDPEPQALHLFHLLPLQDPHWFPRNTSSYFWFISVSTLQSKQQSSALFFTR